MGMALTTDRRLRLRPSVSLFSVRVWVVSSLGQSSLGLITLWGYESVVVFTGSSMVMSALCVGL
jgi:hypothetical protein